MTTDSDPKTTALSRRSKKKALFTWRVARRIVVGLAVLATLTAVFYAEENWRGQRAWAKVRQEFIDRGELLDWPAYIPAPIPDEQNVFKAPKISAWFGQRGTNEWTNPAADLETHPQRLKANVVLELLVAPGGAGIPRDFAEATLAYDGSTNSATAARARLSEIISAAITPAPRASDVARLRGVQGQQFVARPLLEVHRARVAIQTQSILSSNDVAKLLPFKTVSAEVGRLKLHPAGANVFQLVLSPPEYTASEYLAWSDQFLPNFDVIREALKRPLVQIEGNYARPYSAPFPNFLALRNAAQTLAVRAQCRLLTDRPEEALREVTLVRDLCRLTRGKPTVLVSAMIESAIIGVYLGAIADGLKFKAWREPELLVLQEQLKEINLPPLLVYALQVERAAFAYEFQNLSLSEMGNLGFFEARSPWEKWTNPRFWFMAVAPRGWIYQNIADGVAQTPAMIGAFDPTNQLVRARQTEAAMDAFRSRSGKFAEYCFLARDTLPNYVSAWAALARNQSLVQQASVACALERHRLAQGGYPETLAALAPQYIEKLPTDIMSGQSLKYRRIADHQFLLYSVGWNEKDDGGTPGTKGEPKEGDWVWGGR